MPLQISPWRELSIFVVPIVAVNFIIIIAIANNTTETGFAPIGVRGVGERDMYFAEAHLFTEH